MKNYSRKNEVLHIRVKDYRLGLRRIEPASCHKNSVPLIFLHEGLGCIDMWRNFPETLCAAARSPGLVYERRGYGMSDLLPDGPWPVNYLAEEAAVYLPALLDTCGIGECILIGHSDGGSIALIAGSLFVNRFRGIITEAAHIYNEEITCSGIREVVKMYEKGNLREKLARYHGKNTDAVFWRWADTWLSPEFIHWNIGQYLKDICCPLLLLQGENDEYATVGHVKDIAEQVSGPVKLRIIPNCGHVPHFQAGERVQELMREFIESLI